MNKGKIIEIGITVDKKYDILEVINSGGAGQVYKVRQSGLDVIRALKTLLPEHKLDDSFQETFKREIMLLSQLTHQNIVKIIDAGIDKKENISYLVMEYINGKHIDVCAKELENIEDLISLIYEMFDGIFYLHERKILHSDLKPSNILVETDVITKKNHIKIADLGAAKDLSRKIPYATQLELVSDSEELTRVFGTRKYAPPELQRDLNENPITDRELVDLFPYVDIYCLGATLAEVVSTEKIKKNIRDEADYLLSKPMSYIGCNIEKYKYIKGIIIRMLKLKNEKDAFKSINEAYEAFQRIDPNKSLPIRVPELTDVSSIASILLSDGMHHFTNRAYKLIIHPTFQRLQKINHLGFIDLIYPCGRHSRFSHSLEVFSIAKKAVLYLLKHSTFRFFISAEDISLFLASALLHDIGHFPLAHALEDIESVKLDYEMVEYFLNKRTINCPESLGDILKKYWSIDGAEVAKLVDNKLHEDLSLGGRFFHQLMSGPLDVDKMGYVTQDSIFTGVPFGKGVDVEYLLSSLVALSNQDYKSLKELTLGIDSRGIEAASGLISARAALYERVYWHHTNRAIMSMIKYVANKVFESGNYDFQNYVDDTWNFTEYEAVKFLINKLPDDGLATPQRNPALGICDGSRQLYKRIISYSMNKNDDMIMQIYNNLRTLNDNHIEAHRKEILKKLKNYLNIIDIEDYEVLIDIPKPFRAKDTLSTINVVDRYNREKITPLNQISKIVEQYYYNFIENVTKIRIFVSPRIREKINEKNMIEQIIEQINLILKK